MENKGHFLYPDPGYAKPPKSWARISWQEPLGQIETDQVFKFTVDASHYLYLG